MSQQRPQFFLIEDAAAIPLVRLSAGRYVIAATLRDENIAAGPFETTIDFTTQRHGLGALTVYEVSPEDGSQQYLVEIPIAM